MSLKCEFAILRFRLTELPRISPDCVALDLVDGAVLRVGLGAHQVVDVEGAKVLLPPGHLVLCAGGR